jgi:hypothetical protein
VCARLLASTTRCGREAENGIFRNSAIPLAFRPFFAWKVNEKADEKMRRTAADNADENSVHNKRRNRGFAEESLKFALCKSLRKSF